MEPMPVNLSIKNAPDDVVERLRARAARNHRSLQGELLAIVEEAVRAPSPRTATDVIAELRALGLETPAESVGFVRADRDAR
jgi:plasmid stability protein